MSSSEDIKRLSDMSGASYDKAANVYESTNCDFYAALGKLRAEGFDGNGFAGEQYTQNGNTSRFSDNDNILTRFYNSYISIRPKGRGAYRFPLLIAALIVIFGFEVVIPAFVIALVCGVDFTLEGPLFGTAKPEPAAAGAGFSGQGYSDPGIAYEMPRREYEYAQGSSYGSSQAPKYGYGNAQNGSSYQNAQGQGFGNGYAQNNSSYGTGKTPRYEYQQNEYQRDISEEKGFF